MYVQGLAKYRPTLVLSRTNNATASRKDITGRMWATSIQQANDAARPRRYSVPYAHAHCLCDNLVYLVEPPNRQTNRPDIRSYLSRDAECPALRLCF